MNKYVEVLKACDSFKVGTLFWDHDVLTHEENSLRNYPAPWIKKTIELLQLIEGKVVVEIGSTRRELVQSCLNYYNNCHIMQPAQAPPCCQDGHSTHFWVDAGFETYTVDIDSNCIKHLENQYAYHLKTPMPENLHICIPQDGIEFLQNFDKKIDLLFLDGWDKGTNQYAERHLEAFLAAQDKLADFHIISIDDTDFNTESSGKDKLLTPHLLENEYVKVLWGRQTVFIKQKLKKMEMSIGEIVDRFSIIKLKSERTDVNCKEEFEALASELQNIPDVANYVRQLYEINGRIWDLESDIRKGKEGELGLEEIGRRAIRIRSFNGERIAVKNTINTIYKTGFVETKINHASA